MKRLGLILTTVGGVVCLLTGAWHMEELGFGITETTVLADLTNNTSDEELPVAEPDWTATGGQMGSAFGYSVSTAGDVNGDGFSDFLVGAYLSDNGETDEGQVFLYLGSDSDISSVPAWTSEGNQAVSNFGHSVAPVGDVNGDGFNDVIVGAFRYDNTESDEGGVFLYLGSPSGLSATPSWSGQNNRNNTRFGWAVSPAGDVNGDGFWDVLVGADLFGNGQIHEGKASLYLGSASGLSVLPAWEVEGEQPEARFGISPSMAGDVNSDGFGDVLIGAAMFDNGESNEGRVSLYLGSASGLDAQASWTAESDQVDAQFGISVSAAVDVNGDGFGDVVIGAHRYAGDASFEGRVYVYHGYTGGLGHAPAVIIEEEQGLARFGRAVASAGDFNGDGYADILASSVQFDHGEVNEGQVRLYLGSPLGIGTVPAWISEGNQDNALFGLSAATAGDVNGDGFSDILVGAPLFDESERDEGKAFLFLGSGAPLSSSHVWLFEGNQSGASAGSSVASAGDVNGDGYSDVVVGIPSFDTTSDGTGVATIFLGTPLGLASTPAFFAASGGTYSGFGTAVNSAGDVNGDGFGDVIVGAYRYTNGEYWEGRAFVYHGSETFMDPTPDWIGESTQIGSEYGVSVSSAGDVNGDGFGDVIVGANDYTNELDREGRAFVYLGSPSGLHASPHWVADGNDILALFGKSVASAGDVNGDGFSDVLVGAPDSDEVPLPNREGMAYLFFGSASGLSVASAGDVNGDGYSDVVVSSRSYSNGEWHEGRAYLYLGAGNPVWLSETPAWKVESNLSATAFGASLSGAGDVNGDGFADLIVGSPGFRSGEGDEGGAFVYYGNRQGGLDRVPRQLRVDQSAPIAPFGKSDSTVSFRLQALGRTPEGRGWVALEWEVKPFAQRFNGQDQRRGAFYSTGGARPGSTNPTSGSRTAGSSVELDEIADGLDPGTPYHWRARIVTRNPYFPHSRWFTVGQNGPRITDLRTETD